MLRPEFKRPPFGSLALAMLCAIVVACRSRTDASNTQLPESRPLSAAPAAANTNTRVDGPPSGDLIDELRNGVVDAQGPFVDLGEAQASRFLIPPLPLQSQSLNGTSWTRVGTRLRLRLPVSTRLPPTVLRMRVRRAQARRVLVIVDGLLARQAPLPQGVLPQVLNIPLSPDRFRRDVAEIELRFVGVARAIAPPLPAVRPGAPARVATPVAQPPVIDIDWLHFSRDDVPAPRVSDLASDVRVSGPPRRALTLYPPLSLHTLLVVAPRSTFRASLAAEGVRGGGGRAASVVARVRVETDGSPPVERIRTVQADTPWEDLSLDLSPFAGRAVRITVQAAREQADLDPVAVAPLPPPRVPTRPARPRRVASQPSGGRSNARRPPRLPPLAQVPPSSLPAEQRPRAQPTRLVVAEPRIEVAPSATTAVPPPVRRVLMIVVRGARLDRFLPSLSPRLNSGGFARMMRESVVARAIAPSPRELSSLASAVTGLPADVHRLTEITDTLHEQTPSLVMQLHAAGVATAGFSDDRWVFGSGIDRGLDEIGSCPREAATCRSDAILGQAVEFLVRRREDRALSLVITRAGATPFDPAPELLQQVDPSPAEGALQPEQTAQLAARSRSVAQVFVGGPNDFEGRPARAALRLESRDVDRVNAIYDASMMGLDRALNVALDRLRDAGLANDTAVIIVGDRGVALFDATLVGDAPMFVSGVSQTILMVRSPGVAPRVLAEDASVLDAAATVLERLGVPPAVEDPAGRAGAVSLVQAREQALHPRGVVIVGNMRGDLGLSLGGVLVLPWLARGYALVSPSDDPLGASDLSASRPIVRSLAETILGAYRSPAPDQPTPRVYSPSTRPLPPAVETALRNALVLPR